MRYLILLTLAFTLAMGEARALDYYKTLDLLGITYTVGKSPDVEGIGRTRAVYSTRDDTIIISSKSFFERESTYLHTVLHELVHWTGFREGVRSYRGDKGDTFFEEVVAETGALMLSEILYKGEYVFSKEDMHSYLSRHPLSRKLDHKEMMLALSEAYKAAKYLLGELIKVDTKNELGIY